MARIQIVPEPAKALTKADGVVLVAPERALKAGWLQNAVDAEWTALLERAANETDAGASGTTVRAQNPGDGPREIVLVVLPDERSRHNCQARSDEAAAGIRGAGISKWERLAVIVCAEEEAHRAPLIAAVARAFPRFDRKTENGKKPKKKTKRVSVAFTDADGVRMKVPAAEKTLVEGVQLAAELVDMPTEDMHTNDFVRVARREAKETAHLKLSVISGKDLLAKGLGGLHAVGRTANRPPRLLILDWNPPKAKRTVALIGKGVMYDTGGLSLKVGGHMAGMKMDMGGAAGMLGATLALVRSNCKERVICACGLVENSIGPDSYRPDDILEMHSGHTVEINNTDAEGRLVLGDAASYIARKFKVDLLIDMATLTGAQLVATGRRHAAVVSNREGLEAAALRAGRASGDLTSPLPFAPEFFQAEFASKVADMKNSVADRMNAQSSCAAQFVYAHIDDLDIPWLHVDIAGPAFRDGRGTGFGVALLWHLVRNLKAADLA